MPQPSPAASVKPTAIPWWQWGHVLSLEAPLVAVLWLLGLAKLHGISLLPGVATGLGLTVWLVYLLDRTLDTLGKTMESLDRRHQFYLRYRVWILALILPAGTIIAGWMALFVIPSGLMWHCFAIALLVAIYLAAYAMPAGGTAYTLLTFVAGMMATMTISKLPLVQAPKLAISVLMLALVALMCLRRYNERCADWFPKPLAAGILFAFGTVAAIRFFDYSGSVTANLLESLLLILLFTSNLTSTTVREEEEQDSVSPTRKLNRSMLCYAILVSGVCLFLGTSAFPPRLAVMAIATLIGAVLLVLLHVQRRRFSPDLYRVLTDVALLLPLSVLFGYNGN